MFVCKICKEKYSSLEGLYSHLEEEHSAQIPPDMSTAHFYYYLKTGREHGNCVMCKQPTTFNEKTKKYNRFCNDPACKMKYKEIVDKRMIGVYGKVNLLNDPNHQRKMLMNRSISGLYNFKGVDKPYVGSYELDFLKTMDLFFDWDPSDIVSPSPHTYYYVYEGEKHFYIPDFYIMSLGLEIEVKDGGDNPNMHHKIQDVDKEKEKLKDKVMHTQKINHYIKITNKNYYNLFEFFRISKEYVEKYGDYEKIPKIILDEDIKSKTINSSSKSKMSKEVNKAVNESYVSDIDILKLNGYEPVEELFGAKKAEKQARREEQQMQEFISHTVQINKSELSSCIKEFERLTNSVKNILKKEMPGCKFYSEKINHQTHEKGGYEVHFIDVKLFEMDDNNFTKFKNNSKNKLLKTADEVYDYADDMLSDINKRIVTPIKQLGLKKNTDYDEWAYSKYRDGKPYITVDVTPNLAPRVFLVMTLVIKQDNVIKESYEPVEEGYVFSKDNLYINFEKFESGKSNICLITGLSGSGKSTLGKQLANKYHAEYVELDTFYNIGTVSYEDLNGTIYKEYADENKKDYEWLVSKKTSMNKIPNDLVIRMVQWIIRYCKKNKNKKYILEGVQIYSHGDAKVIKNEPLILINASMIKSIYQRHKREDSNNVNWKTQLKELPEIVRWYVDDEKQYNKFKKEIVEESYVCFPLLNSIISSKYDDIKSKEQYKRDVNAFKQHFLKGISRIDNIDDAKAMKGDLQALMSYLNGIKYTNNYSEFKNINAVKEIEAWICRVAIPELDLKINKYSRNLEPVNEYAHNITFAINNNLQRGIFGMMDNISSITIDDSIQLKRKNTVMQVITENLKYDDNTTIIKFGTDKDVSLNNDLNNNIGSYLNWNKNNGINALLKNVSDELFNSKISIEDFHKIEGGDE